MAQQTIKPTIKQKTTTTHSIFIVCVCLVFGVMNFFTKNFLIGGLTIGLGAATGVFTFLFKKKLAPTTMGFVLSIIQLLLILCLSAFKHEMLTMFPLILASMAISAIYYSKRCIITHWVIMDVAAIVGIIFNDFFYGGIDIAAFIKGFAGINVGGFLLLYLMNTSLSYISEAHAAKAESDKLIAEVQGHIAKAEETTAHQTQVVDNIAEIAKTLTSSGDKINSISTKISSAANTQQVTIAGIAEDINHITAETENSIRAAEKASESAAESTSLINLSNDEMQKMIAAMSEIEESSDKIKLIVKTIEDIAFQTNILALNASIEAARAGSAGKGFAVVADEVRNLAGKSQNAVEDTSKLIDSSIDAVHRGRDVADGVAERMNSVLAAAENSAEQADSIAKLTEKQAADIMAVKERILQMSDIVERTSQTALESSEISGSVADDIRKLDDIVQSFSI